MTTTWRNRFRAIDIIRGVHWHTIIGVVEFIIDDDIKSIGDKTPVEIVINGNHWLTTPLACTLTLINKLLNTYEELEYLLSVFNATLDKVSRLVTTTDLSKPQSEYAEVKENITIINATLKMIEKGEFKWHLN